MSKNDESRQERAQKGFEQTLNSQGYSFQYSVVKAAQDLYPHSSAWRFEATEFPVEVRGSTTRIDILLKHKQSRPFYLLAECKRVNPALSNWCFVRAPYVHNYMHRNAIVLERAEYDVHDLMSAFANEIVVSDELFHIALEAKSDDKGEPRGPSRGTIEDSVTQVLRGLNGMIDFVSGKRDLFENERRIDFLPVVFTTAQIWSSDVDLSTANIETGNIELSKTNFIRRDWLIYQYHMSPGLKHSHVKHIPGTIGEIMQQQYIRSIAIVSPTGIAPFLKWASSISTW